MRRTAHIAAAMSLAAAALFAHMPAAAAEKYLIGYQDRELYYLIADSVKRVDGVTQAWLLKDAHESDGSNSQKVLYRIDCAKERLGVQSSVHYSGADGTGDVMSSADAGDGDREMTAPVPESLGEAVSKNACLVASKGLAKARPILKAQHASIAKGAFAWLDELVDEVAREHDDAASD